MFFLLEGKHVLYDPPGQAQLEGYGEGSVSDRGEQNGDEDVLDEPPPVDHHGCEEHEGRCGEQVAPGIEDEAVGYSQDHGDENFDPDGPVRQEIPGDRLRLTGTPVRNAQQDAGDDGHGPDDQGEEFRSRVVPRLNLGKLHGGVEIYGSQDDGNQAAGEIFAH
ncbi:hypothetical protein SDC9_50524 [bioreactor metagenome]|uniref:Uncharacterized protein n=1 Tax=bioreactor metagenome TaxID=1076179 RepID=A0A644WKV4_9ZZZZ